MALLTYADRVAETTITTGTGTISLLGASDAKFRTFVAGAGTGNTVPYVIVHRTANEYEVGFGVVTSGSPDTLTRGGVYASSTGSAINFSAGTKDVFLSLPASKTARFDDATDATTLTALTVTGAATAGKLVPTANTVTGNGMYLPTTNTLAFSTDGTERARIDASGNLIPGSTNAYDLGAAGTRFRDGWFARDVAVEGNASVGTSIAAPAKVTVASGNAPYLTVKPSTTSGVKRNYVFGEANLLAGQSLRISNTTNVAGRVSGMFLVKFHGNQIVSNIALHHAYSIFSFRVFVPAAGGTPAIEGLTEIASYGWTTASNFTFTGSAGGTFTLDFANHTGVNNLTVAAEIELLSGNPSVVQSISSTFTTSVI